MTGAVLLGYQRRWVKDNAQVKLIEKSRRIGLSYCEASDAVLHAAAAGGANVYYISYDKEMTAGFVQDCATWAKAFHAAAGAVGESVLTRDDGRDIHVYDIPFDSGHHIRTFSSNPRNLRGKGRPGERLIIDEAAFVDDLSELLKAALAMTMWGGQIHVISTHNGEESPFNELINDVRAGRFDFSLHRVTLDDAIADGLYRRICEVTGREWSAETERAWRADLVKRYRPNEDEELFCIPSMGGGAYLPRALIEARMVDVPVVRFDGAKAFNMAPEPERRAEMADWLREHVKPLLDWLDPKRRHVAGMDFARVGDMTDIVPIEIGATLKRRVPFIVEMHNVPFAQQQQALFYALDGLPRFGGAAIDAGGNGAQIAEAAADRYGSIIEEIKFTEDWYRLNMPPYKAAFEDGLIEIPRHDDVLEDHRAIKLVRGVPRVPPGKTDKKGERHGDSAIAGALAYYKADQDPVEISYQSAGTRAAQRLDQEAYGKAPSHPTDTGWGTIPGSNDFGGYA